MSCRRFLLINTLTILVALIACYYDDDYDDYSRSGGGGYQEYDYPQRRNRGYGPRSRHGGRRHRDESDEYSPRRRNPYRRPYLRNYALEGGDSPPIVDEDDFARRIAALKQRAALNPRLKYKFEESTGGQESHFSQRTVRRGTAPPQISVSADNRGYGFDHRGGSNIPEAMKGFEYDHAFNQENNIPGSVSAPVPPPVPLPEPVPGPVPAPEIPPVVKNYALVGRDPYPNDYFHISPTREEEMARHLGEPGYDTAVYDTEWEDYIAKLEANIAAQRARRRRAAARNYVLQGGDPFASFDGDNDDFAQRIEALKAKAARNPRLKYKFEESAGGHESNFHQRTLRRGGQPPQISVSADNKGYGFDHRGGSNIPEGMKGFEYDHAFGQDNNIPAPVSAPIPPPVPKNYAVSGGSDPYGYRRPAFEIDPQHADILRRIGYNPDNIGYDDF